MGHMFIPIQREDITIAVLHIDGKEENNVL